MNYNTIGFNKLGDKESIKTEFKYLLILILSIMFIPAAYILVAAVFIVQIVQLNKFKIDIRRLKRNKTKLLILTYILTGVLFSEYKLISSVYGIIMFLCFNSFLLFENIKLEINFKKAVYILSVIVFLIGIIQYVNPQFSIPNKWIDAGEYNINKRIYSTFFNPNIFGFYINFIIILIVENLELKKFNLESIVFILGIICLILTFSRAAWVSLIISLLIASLFNKKYFKLAILISLIIFGIDFYLGTNRINISKAAEDSSLTYRIEIWKSCIKIFRDNLLTGIGFGTLSKYITEYSNIVKPNIEHSHNLYLQILSETGIIGATVFLFIIFNILRIFWVKLNSKNKEPWITAMTIFFMTMIHGLIDSVFFTPQIMMVLSIYVGFFNYQNCHPER